MELSEKTALRLWAGVAAIEDHPAEVVKFAQAVEAEVRKDDEALFRQMLEAVDLGKKLALTGGVFTPPELALLTAASTAARARLEKAP